MEHNLIYQGHVRVASCSTTLVSTHPHTHATVHANSPNFLSRGQRHRVDDVLLPCWPTRTLAKGP
ncbi:hypothetical protein B0F90DRAFT_1213069 [Multifurca ochricompacta]|uniref:Uncharacterized protein n=1 Tax=Multifurca ochricompacta TaxID=376703 RepID=A0AAD4QHY2_9AGAM|nr:hypothetical protein B0F90DRAFT_1213069 [Multifurca ochricompacta]